MSRSKFVLINSEILPEVYHKVLKAKNYLATNQAASASQAAKMAGLSRSAYYKYKDAVYEYKSGKDSSMVTIFLTLADNPGVLSTVMNILYKVGANILSVNQNIPVNNVATISITMRIDQLQIELSELIEQVREIRDVKSVEELNE